MATYWENSCSFGLRYVSWYKYLIVSLVFSHLGFWSGNLFLIAPFPDLCLLVNMYISVRVALCHNVSVLAVAIFFATMRARLASHGTHKLCFHNSAVSILIDCSIFAKELVFGGLHRRRQFCFLILLTLRKLQ